MFTEFKEWTPEPIPPGDCGECVDSSGQLYPDCWIAGTGWVDTDESEGASCVTCKGTGKTDLVERGRKLEWIDVVGFLRRQGFHLAADSIARGDHLK